MNIHCVEQSREVLGEAQEKLHALLEENKANHVLLLLSGGSAFDLLSGVPSEVLGSHITCGVLDERYSTDAAVNNFAHISSLEFFTVATQQGVHFIDTRVQEGQTLEQSANEFEQHLRTWYNTHQNGVIIATQGIGLDGHTAGIMPYPDDKEEFEKLFCDPAYWVRGYDVGVKNQYPLRITTTVPFLKKITHTLVYCVGSNKKDALARVMAEQGNLHETPARILREMNEVNLFTDIKV